MDAVFAYPVNWWRKVTGRIDGIDNKNVVDIGVMSATNAGECQKMPATER